MSGGFTRGQNFMPPADNSFKFSKGSLYKPNNNNNNNNFVQPNTNNNVVPANGEQMKSLQMKNPGLFGGPNPQMGGEAQNFQQNAPMQNGYNNNNFNQMNQNNAPVAQNQNANNTNYYADPNVQNNTNAAPAKTPQQNFQNNAPRSQNAPLNPNTQNYYKPNYNQNSGSNAKPYENNQNYQNQGNQNGYNNNRGGRVNTNQRENNQNFYDNANTQGMNNVPVDRFENDAVRKFTNTKKPENGTEDEPTPVLNEIGTKDNRANEQYTPVQPTNLSNKSPAVENENFKSQNKPKNSHLFQQN